jgi:hypothetical protein
MDKKETPEKIMVIIAFLIMIAFIMLSYFLPAGGQNITEIMASYPNLFTPADYSFLMWWIIYLLFTGFVIYQLGLFGHKHLVVRPEALHHTRMIFIGICAMSAVCIMAWQFDYLALSAMLVLIMLACIRFLCRYLTLEDMSGCDRVFIRLPFSILYAWLTILTISTLAILFVSIRWKAFGIPLTVWAVATFVILAVYAVMRSQKNKDFAYCFTMIWLYIGLLVKHTAKDGMNGKYPAIIAAIIFGILILAGCAGVLLYRKRKIQ